MSPGAAPGLASRVNARCAGAPFRCRFIFSPSIDMHACQKGDRPIDGQAARVPCFPSKGCMPNAKQPKTLARNFIATPHPIGAPCWYANVGSRLTRQAIATNIDPVRVSHDSRTVGRKAWGLRLVAWKMRREACRMFTEPRRPAVRFAGVRLGTGGLRLETCVLGLGASDLQRKTCRANGHPRPSLSAQKKHATPKPRSRAPNVSLPNC